MLELEERNLILEFLDFGIDAFFGVNLLVLCADVIVGFPLGGSRSVIM